MAVEFEWDDNKASVNWRQHGVEFRHAVRAFCDLLPWSESMITTARIRADGKVVRISKGGKQSPFPEKPLRPMTEAQVKAAAYADPDDER